MWIEAENGSIYNTAYIQRFGIRAVDGGYVIEAEFATEGSATVTLKTFDNEFDAQNVVKGLKGRLEKVIQLVAPRATG